MDATIIISLAISVITVIGNILVSKITHDKTITLIEYRLQQLEVAQNKHNNLMQRTYELEREVAIIKEDRKNDKNN